MAPDEDMNIFVFANGMSSESRQHNEEKGKSRAQARVCKKRCSGCFKKHRGKLSNKLMLNANDSALWGPGV